MTTNPQDQPRRVEAVIFDLDGLLLNTEILARKALRLAAAEVGLAIDDDFGSLMIGVPADACRDLVIDRFGVDAPADQLFLASRRHLHAQIDEGLMTLKPGALELLAQLDAAGLPRAVATSSSRSKAMHHLLAAGIDQRFGEIVTRDDVERGKPWPDIYLCAAQRLHVSPSGCLVLEDSYNGVRSAHAAGMRVIMVPDLLPPTQEMEDKCWAVVPDLHAVAAVCALC